MGKVNGTFTASVENKPLATKRIKEVTFEKAFYFIVRELPMLSPGTLAKLLNDLLATEETSGSDLTSNYEYQIADSDF